MHKIENLSSLSLYINQSSLIFSLKEPYQIPGQIFDIIHLKLLFWRTITRESLPDRKHETDIITFMSF